MKFWEEVAKPTWKEVKLLRTWQQPLGYALVAIILPVFYLAYLITSAFGRDL